jgi:hypothetical protein
VEMSAVCAWRITSSFERYGTSGTSCGSRPLPPHRAIAHGDHEGMRTAGWR